MAEVQSTFSLKPGDAAPAFALPDPRSEREWSLQALEAGQPFLIAFVCNHCPFVVHLAEALGEFAREVAGQGVATIAISSNDVENYPQDAPEKMVQFARVSGWDFPYLFDEDQAVAKTYGAACTPDFFLFDGQGELFYAGQFDDSRPRGGAAKVTGKDLRAAVNALLAGQKVPSPVYPSSGCNIKWKKGNEPAYFG
ncbi:MAG: thioredoxin family protein [Verrucomicrobiota bacterium]